MDPKKKKIVLISVLVLVAAAGGYAFLFGGDKVANTQNQGGPLVKKEARGPARGELKKGGIKKKAKATITKKTGLVKKEAQGRKRNTLKKRPGQRGNRKAKKKELVPAA